MQNAGKIEKATETTKHHSKILNIRILGFIAVIFGILKLTITLFSGQIIYASDLTLDNILSAINKERGLRNLITLNTDNRLSYAAQDKAQDMIVRHYFSHTDPEGNYIWPKIVAAGYTPYVQLGENLAIEFYNTESLVSAWMNSPTHRANILNEGFKDQGMGLDFGNTQNNQYSSAIVNTFGALMVKKIVSPPPPPKEQTPSNQTLPSNPPPSSLAPPTSTPAKNLGTPENPPTASTSLVASNGTNKKPSESLAIRGNLQEPNFTTAALHQASTSSESQKKDTLKTKAPISIQNANVFNSLKANRYLSLGLGIAILLLLLSDLKITLEKKLSFLDKKINNLLLLILSLLVIAFMYWL